MSTESRPVRPLVFWPDQLTTNMVLELAQRDNFHIAGCSVERDHDGARSECVLQRPIEEVIIQPSNSKETRRERNNALANGDIQTQAGKILQKDFHHNGILWQILLADYLLRSQVIRQGLLLYRFHHPPAPCLSI